MSLKGQVCIITGGGSGIGRDAALLMASDGATIVLVGRTEAKIEAVKVEIESDGGSATTYALSVADYTAVCQMVDGVTQTYGQIDVLVNNAGHSSLHRRLLNSPPEEVLQVIDSNLIGTFFCTQAVVPTMLKAQSGTIINVSSLAGVTPGPFSGFAYGAAKAGVINFSVLIPGEVNTPILDKRPITPEEDARKCMVDVAETSAAIHLIASLPPRTNIPQLVIRPTWHRNLADEIVEQPELNI